MPFFYEFECHIQGIERSLDQRTVFGGNLKDTDVSGWKIGRGVEIKDTDVSGWKTGRLVEKTIVCYDKGEEIYQ